MKVVTVATQKGGSGKTTASVHLAVGLQRAGYRVLAIDLDQQCHLTKWLLPSVPAGASGAAGVLESGEAPTEEDLLAVPGREGLWVLPGTVALRRANITLRDHPGADRVLANALQSLDEDFDYCVIDTPPAAELVTFNALGAADHVLVPVTSAYLSLDGLGELKKTLDLVRARTNPKLSVLGYLHMAVNAGHAVSREVRDVLAKGQGGKLLKGEVRTSNVQATIQAHRLTAWDKDAGDERGRVDWTALLPELLERMGVKAGAKAKAADKTETPKAAGKAKTQAKGDTKGRAKAAARKGAA